MALLGLKRQHDAMKRKRRTEFAFGEEGTPPPFDTQGTHARPRASRIKKKAKRQASQASSGSDTAGQQCSDSVGSDGGRGG
eukprot:10793552-Alexandrium_andersonii.AAC.1